MLKCQKRPIIRQKRPTHMAKEGGCGMLKCQKRPIHTAKEAYSYGKRDLFIRQKRPIEIGMPVVCISIKRGRLATWQKRPTNTQTKEAYYTLAYLLY